MEVLSNVEIKGRLKLNKVNISERLSKSNIKGLRISGSKSSVKKIIEKNSESDTHSEYEEEDFVLNENVYKERIHRQLRSLENLAYDVKESVRKEHELSNQLAELSKLTVATTDTQEHTLSVLLNQSSLYQNVLKKVSEAHIGLAELEKTYNELERVVEDIDVVEKRYSRTTESVYVTIEGYEVVKLLNKVSSHGKRMVILSDDVFEREKVKVRFSNHIPSYYKCNKSAAGYKEYRDTNMLVLYDELNGELKSKKVNNKNKRSIKEDIERVKSFSSKKMDRLSKDELEEYYELVMKLINEESLKDNKFVGSLDNAIVGLRRRLSLT